MGERHCLSLTCNCIGCCNWRRLGYLLDSHHGYPGLSYYVATQVFKLCNEVEGYLIGKRGFPVSVAAESEGSTGGARSAPEKPKDKSAPKEEESSSEEGEESEEGSKATDPELPGHPARAPAPPVKSPKPSSSSCKAPPKESTSTASAEGKEGSRVKTEATKDSTRKPSPVRKGGEKNSNPEHGEVSSKERSLKEEKKKTRSPSLRRKPSSLPVQGERKVLRPRSPDHPPSDRRKKEARKEKEGGNRQVSPPPGNWKLRPRSPSHPPPPRPRERIRLEQAKRGRRTLNPHFREKKNRGQKRRDRNEDIFVYGKDPLRKQRREERESHAGTASRPR